MAAILVLMYLTVVPLPKVSYAEEPISVSSDFEDGTTQGWHGRGGNEILTATASQPIRGHTAFK